MPAEKGEMRNLTNTPGVMEREPGMVAGRQERSPTSRDEIGRVRAAHQTAERRGGDEEDRAGREERRSTSTRNGRPISKSIAFNDNMDNLWRVEIASGKVTKVDTDYLYDLNRDFNWSRRFEVDRVRAIPAQPPARDLGLFSAIPARACRSPTA